MSGGLPVGPSRLRFDDLQKFGFPEAVMPRLDRAGYPGGGTGWPCRFGDVRSAVGARRHRSPPGYPTPVDSPARVCPRHALAALNGITGVTLTGPISEGTNEWERKALELAEERSQLG